MANSWWPSRASAQFISATCGHRRLESSQLVSETTTTQGSDRFGELFFCVLLCNVFPCGRDLPLSEPTKKDMGDGGHAGPSKRRRERRLRHFLRHERLTVAMLLAERERHHTAPRGLRRLLGEFHFLHCDAVRTWKMWCILSSTSSYLEDLASVSGCCLWSGVQDLGFFGRCCVYFIHAQCLARQWIHLLHQCLVAFGRSAHIFYVEVDSDPEVSCLHFVAEWRSVLSRCFSLQFRFALLALVNLNTSFLKSTSLVTNVMTDGMAGSLGVSTPR